MFPLIGILVAAILLFKGRKKPVPVIAPAPVKTSTKPATTAPAKAATKPAAKPTQAPAKITTKLPVSSIQGLPIPSASQYTSDLFGSMLGTNPKVLSPTLPYGYYNPTGNTTGQTPPVVAPYYR
jgi:hypothetical protein